MDKSEIVKRVERLLKDSKNVVMVLSTDSNCKPHGRYMDCTKDKNGLALYFATFVNTEKVGQIKSNQNIEVIVTSKDLNEVANLDGTAGFLNPENEKEFSNKKSFLISRFSGLDIDNIIIMKFVPKAIKYLNQKDILRPLPIYNVTL